MSELIADREVELLVRETARGDVLAWMWQKPQPSVEVSLMMSDFCMVPLCVLPGRDIDSQPMFTSAKVWVAGS
jgi:hypothetical protein